MYMYGCVLMCIGMCKKSMWMGVCAHISQCVHVCTVLRGLTCDLSPLSVDTLSSAGISEVDIPVGTQLFVIEIHKILLPSLTE